MARRLQATALCILALALCAAITPAEATGYYAGHRRLSEASGRQMLTYYGDSHRKLSTYYDGAHRRLQGSGMFVRPLFDNSFAAGAADVPVPQFLARQLKGASRQLSTYYGDHRRLQGAGRQLSTYYGDHRRLQGAGRQLSTYYSAH